YISLILLLMLPVLNSCKKEPSCENCRSLNGTNKPPNANAGLDQVITLPTDSVLLDGRTSSDPDGIISEWLWTKISGPASFNIIKPSDSITKVKSLVAGSYLFELKVIDIYDVSSNTWSIAELSKARGRMAVAAIGNKVFFAGGDCFDLVTGGISINSVSDVVDIYDISTNTWTVSHLSERRGNLEFAGT